MLRKSVVQVLADYLIEPKVAEWELLSRYQDIRLALEKWVPNRLHLPPDETIITHLKLKPIGDKSKQLLAPVCIYVLHSHRRNNKGNI